MNLPLYTRRGDIALAAAEIADMQLVINQLLIVRQRGFVVLPDVIVNEPFAVAQARNVAFSSLLIDRP